jgi:hypothetical protein
MVVSMKGTVSNDVSRWNPVEFRKDLESGDKITNNRIELV